MADFSNSKYYIKKKSFYSSLYFGIHLLPATHYRQTQANITTFRRYHVGNVIIIMLCMLHFDFGGWEYPLSSPLKFESLIILKRKAGKADNFLRNLRPAKSEDLSFLKTTLETVSPTNTFQISYS